MASKLHFMFRSILLSSFLGGCLSGCGGGNENYQVTLPDDLSLSVFLDRGTVEGEAEPMNSVQFTVHSFNGSGIFSCVIEHNSWFSPDWNVAPTNASKGLYVLVNYDQSTGKCEQLTFTWADPWNASMTKPAQVNLYDVIIPAKTNSSTSTLGRWDGQVVPANPMADSTAHVHGTGGSLSRN